MSLAEAYEYEAILQQMLGQVPDSIDKREGSVIYHTLAPVAFALAQQSYMLAYMTDLLFADTAEEEWLDRVTSDFGIDREQATQAVRQINTFDSAGVPMAVPIGSKFAINDLSFTVTEQIDTGQYKAVCDQAGLQGNAYGGAILPVDNINGLAAAELVSPALIPARDAETDDELRARFMAAARRTPYGGNVADYEEKVLAIEGVGSVRIFKASELNAPGSVGIIIGDENHETATQALIDLVAETMGTDGDGVAPIGHTPIVRTSTPLQINVDAPLVLTSGASLAVVQPSVEQAITGYIDGIDFKSPTVYFAKLVADILNAHESIVDVGAVTINGAEQNLTLEKTFDSYQIPVIGTITVSEVTG